MSTSFAVGDKVSFLSDSGTAIVQAVSGDIVQVLDEHGFVTELATKELVPFKEIPSSHIIEKDELANRHQLISAKNQFPSIDLHLHQLVDRTDGLSNHQKLDLQLTAFRRFLLDQESRRTKKMLVVHGVGTGRLKSEIQTIVAGIPGATMHDANFSLNGIGASWIERRYQVR